MKIIALLLCNLVFAAYPIYGHHHFRHPRMHDHSPEVKKAIEYCKTKHNVTRPECEAEDISEEKKVQCGCTVICFLAEMEKTQERLPRVEKAVADCEATQQITRAECEAEDISEEKRLECGCAVICILEELMTREKDFDDAPENEDDDEEFAPITPDTDPEKCQRGVQIMQCAKSS